MEKLKEIEYMSDTEEYLNILHGDTQGWITRAEKSEKDGYRQWHYLFENLKKQEYENLENIFVSLNSFYKPYRRIDTLKELGCCMIDLDVYNTKFTKTQVLMNLNDNYFGKNMPIPNLIVDSGRGLYLLWLIPKVPYKALPLWKAVMEYLYNELKEFGADRKALDPTRIFRVPGSINPKSGTKVKIIEVNKYVWSLREIQREFLPELDENRVKKKGRPKKVVFVHRERSLYQGRILDIAKLCEIREYDVKGYRETILFLYRYYLCYFYEDEKKALEDVLELNKMFKQPLKERELIKATESAEKVFKIKDKDYKYKNDTLIELLQITEKEQEHMTVIIGKSEYKRRDREYQKNRYIEKLAKQGKLTEREKISQRRKKIKDLLAEGLLQKEICDILNISKRNCIRDIKALKEQGLI